MPSVKPFRGLLYSDTRPDAWARVLAPPFDMIRGDEQQALFAADEHNIAWLTVADDGPGYPGVAARLAQWRRDGVITTDAEPAFYVYEQTVGEARLRGFLAAVRLQNPPESAVYPHENTFAEPIVDRLALLKATRCSLEPVFGLYGDGSGQAAEVLRSATREVPFRRGETLDGAVHRLWRVIDPARQQALSEAVSPAKVVIADGHHRWAAARAFREERRTAGATDPEAPHEFGLMFLVEEASGGVECGAFHRVILRLPEGVDPAHLEDLLGPHFAVEDFATEGLSDEKAARAIIARIAHEPGRPVFGCCWRTGAAIVRIRDLEALLATASRRIDPLVRDFDVATGWC
jgi:uncharacterized protein (DUF1015 family)